MKGLRTDIIFATETNATLKIILYTYYVIFIF